MDKAKKVVDAYSNALNLELEKGKQIQRDFLPKEIPHLPDWDIAVCFNPAMQVSGDFYDAFLVNDEILGLVIADVCDKGVGSALFMALIRSLIRVFSEQMLLSASSQTVGNDKLGTTIPVDPAMSLKAVAHTNDYIAKEHGEDGMFATLFFGVLNTKTGLLEFINGGHEPPVIFDSRGIKKRLKPTGPAVGALPHMTFNTGQAILEPGDMLFCFTDGVTEANSPNGDFFTLKRLLSLLPHFLGSVSELLACVNSELSRHIKDAKQFDDITMLAIQRTLKT